MCSEGLRDLEWERDETSHQYPRLSSRLSIACPCTHRWRHLFTRTKIPTSPTSRVNSRDDLTTNQPSYPYYPNLASSASLFLHSTQQLILRFLQKGQLQLRPVSSNPPREYRTSKRGYLNANPSSHWRLPLPLNARFPWLNSGHRSTHPIATGRTT